LTGGSIALMRAFYIMVKKCKVCNKPFKTYPYMIKQGYGKFCSSKCYGVSIKGTPNSPKTQFKKGCKKLLTAYKWGKKDKHPKWKGGKYINKDGYILIRVGKKYIFEHRLVMESYLKRTLYKYEVVHHINEIKTDNRIKNLQVMTRKEHNKLHKLFIEN